DGWADRLDVLGDAVDQASGQRAFSEAAVGSLSIRLTSPPVPHFNEFWFGLRPESNSENPWFREFWEEKFNCSLSGAPGRRRCTARWAEWANRFKCFVTASGITDASQQREILLYVGGKQVAEAYAELTRPGKTLEELLDALREHFKSRHNPVFVRYEFRHCTQQPGEAINAWVQRLFKAAEGCEFETQRDLIIRDQIVAGCQSDQLRRRLLQTPNIQLKEALQQARAFEAADLQSAVIEARKSESVNAMRRIEKPDRPERTRTNCEVFCLTPQRKRLPLVKADINGHATDLLIDSGASCNLMDSKTFKAIGGTADDLRESKQRVFPFGSSEPLTTLGKATLRTAVYDVSASISYIIVKETGTTIVGRETSEKLGILRIGPSNPSVCHLKDSGELHEPLSAALAAAATEADDQAMPQHERLSNIIKTFRQRFVGIGCVKDVEVGIHLQDGAVPVCHPPSRIPRETEPSKQPSQHSEAATPLQATPLPPHAWHTLGIDFTGPVQNKHLLVIVDHFSRYPIVISMSSMTAEAVTKQLRKLFSTFGRPAQLVSDNGPPFSSQAFHDFLRSNGVQHRSITPYHPAANGVTERINRSINKIIRIASIEKSDWRAALEDWLEAYRNTPHSSTGATPAELMFQRQVQDCIPSMRQRSRVPSTLAAVRARDSAAKQRMARHADKRRRAASHNIMTGDSVLRRRRPASKMQTPFEPEPWVVEEVKGDSLILRRAHESCMRHITDLKRLPTADFPPPPPTPPPTEGRPKSPESIALRAHPRSEDLSKGFRQDTKLGLVVNAAWTVAHALHDLHLNICSGAPGPCQGFLPVNGTLLLEKLMRTNFLTYTNERLAFDEKGDPPGRYEILNYQKVKKGNSSGYYYEYMQVAKGPAQHPVLLPGAVQSRRDQEMRKSSQSDSRPGESEKMGSRLMGAPDFWHIGADRDTRCKSCDDMSVVTKEFGEEQCTKCENGTRPNWNQTACEQIPIDYLRWRDTEAIVAVAFSCLGSLVTLWVVFIIFKYYNTPVVKASTRELMLFILFGILLSYLTTFGLVHRPTVVSCYLSRALPGLSLSFIYGALVTKTNRIARILAGSKKKIMTRKPRFLNTGSQIVITCFLISVELSIIVGMLVWERPDAVLDYRQKFRVRLVCNTTPTGVMAPLGFDGFLIVLCTLYAIRTRNLPENFNEAKFIGFTMYTTCVIWLSFVPIYFGSENKVTATCLSVSLSATVALVLLFTPKLYIILVKPEKNSRSAFSTTKEVRCHIGHSNNYNSSKSSHKHNALHE
uniref:Reverse transcriptase n=1 Tax=Macrostomum lignano TaxID=282301 RepID=A0A1I8IF99_9PLAT